MHHKIVIFRTSPRVFVFRVSLRLPSPAGSRPRGLRTQHTHGVCPHPRQESRAGRQPRRLRSRLRNGEPTSRQPPPTPRRPPWIFRRKQPPVSLMRFAPLLPGVLKGPPLWGSLPRRWYLRPRWKDAKLTAEERVKRRTNNASLSDTRFQTLSVPLFSVFFTPVLRFSITVYLVKLTCPWATFNLRKRNRAQGRGSTGSKHQMWMNIR